MTRRRAILLISREFFIGLLRDGDRRYRIENGIPDDAVVIGSRYDPLRDVWEIGLESAEFDEVPEEQMLPELPPAETTDIPDYKGALERIKSELGVPDENYPAPVANAWAIADRILEPTNA